MSLQWEAQPDIAVKTSRPGMSSWNHQMSFAFGTCDGAASDFVDIVCVLWILKLSGLLGRCTAWHFGLSDRTQLDIQATSPPHGLS